VNFVLRLGYAKNGEVCESLLRASVCGLENGSKDMLEVCLQSVQVLREIRTLGEIIGV